jgi:hypothetical protein
MWNLKTLAVFVTLTTTLVAGTAWFSFSRGEQYGMSKIQALWDGQRLATQMEQAEQQMKARQQEQALQAAVNRIKQEKHREAVKLANDYAAVVVSLQDRADRPSDGGVPEDSAVGIGHPGRCTGAELYLSDSRFLAREAVRADQLRLALKACLAHSAEVERQLNGK